MLSRAIKMAFWVFYDHLGKLIVANILCVLAFCVPATIGVTAFMARNTGIFVLVGVPALIVAFGVVLPVLGAGLAHMTKILIETRDGSLRDFFQGVRLYGRRAIGIGLLYIIGIISLSVSIWFYATRLRATVPLLGYGISAIAAWCLLFILLMAALVLPTLVQKKVGVFPTLKLSTLLILDNLFFSIGLALQFLVLAMLSIIPLLFVTVSASAAVVLASSAYEMLARKYQAIQVEQGLIPKPERPAQTICRKGRLEFDDANDDYLNRGLRDFLFPWKG